MGPHEKSYGNASWQDVYSYSTMNVTIRCFEERDYPQLAHLYSTLHPDDLMDAAEIRFFDETRDPKCVFERFVAEAGGRLVGAASYGHEADTYHPNKFNVWLDVLPETRAHNVHTTLYEKVSAGLAQHYPTTLLATLPAHDPDIIDFFKARGFREELQQLELRLTVDDDYVFPYDTEALFQRLRDHDIVIRTLPEVEHDPDYAYKLLRLRNILDQQVPFAYPVTPVNFEWFRHRILGNPNLKRDGLFIATHGDDFVGMSALYDSGQDGVLETGLTGVRADYRRQGIALGFKERAVRYVRERGHHTIRTWNAETNTGVLKLNEKLGFESHTAYIEYVKTFAD